MHDPGDPPKKRLEGVISEILKRAMELGVEKAAEAPESLKAFMHELKLPKEIGGYLYGQIEETKNGVLRVVSKEFRDFLEHTNLVAEIRKLLTTVQFEVHTTIRFSPNQAKSNQVELEAEDESLPKPEVKTEVFVKRDERQDRRRSR